MRPRPGRIRTILPLHSVRKRVSLLLRTPFFWIITLWGNAWVVGGAVAFHYFESGPNPAVVSYIDSLSWAVCMATTVGGGAINPVTTAGKVVSIVMMMGGALFIWAYMALFVGAFVGPELKGIEREVSELQHDLEEGEKLLRRLRVLAEDLDRHLKTKPQVRED